MSQRPTGVCVCVCVTCTKGLLQGTPGAWAGVSTYAENNSLIPHILLNTYCNSNNITIIIIIVIVVTNNSNNVNYFLCA